MGEQAKRVNLNDINFLFLDKILEKIYLEFVSVILYTEMFI